MCRHSLGGEYSRFTMRYTNEEKPREEWDDDERRRIQYNLKAKNIITFALGMDEYFRVYNCKNAKEIWDTLQVTHEGALDSKLSISTRLLACKSNWNVPDQCLEFISKMLLDVTPIKDRLPKKNYDVKRLVSKLGLED